MSNPVFTDDVRAVAEAIDVAVFDDTFPQSKTPAAVARRKKRLQRATDSAVSVLGSDWLKAHVATALRTEAEWLRTAAGNATVHGFTEQQLQGFGWAAGWVDLHAGMVESGHR